MKIFINVNVFIDVMTKRSGWSESLRVLNLARRSQEIESWTSALTLPLLYFFRRRVEDESAARADAQAILKGLLLVPMNETILDRALASAGPDFEDNIQLASAESISVNHLITRNIKDFDVAQIAVLNPENWLLLQEVAMLEMAVMPPTKPLIGMVLVTHARLAIELVTVLEHVVGPQPQVASICIGPDDNMEHRRADILKAVQTVNAGAGVVVLTDMFGGTPSNLAISIMDAAPIEVIAGVNLPMLIKLASVRGSENLQTAVAHAQEAGRKYINVASALLAQER